MYSTIIYKVKFINNFLILKFSFLVDLKSILYLLEFLDQEPSDDNTMTKHFLSTVQSAIRNSCVLKQKIKDYFDKLEITERKRS